ncbi:hypothetical protein GGQ19_002202 [Salinibacter ruber]|nr:hypothetical protein [Salinibacter ruber]
MKEQNFVNGADLASRFRRNDAHLNVSPPPLRKYDPVKRAPRIRKTEQKQLKVF